MTLEEIKRTLLDKEIYVKYKKGYKVHPSLKRRGITLEDAIKEIPNLYEEAKNFPSLEEMLYRAMNDVEKTPLCPYCNAPSKFKYPKGYLATCGNRKCSHRLQMDTKRTLNPEDPFNTRKMKETLSKRTEEDKQKIIEKRKNTTLERYGVENVIQNKEINHKAKETILERYGVENVSQSKEIKQKRENTFLDKYGSKSFTGTEEWKEKTKKTNLEKYGVENAIQNRDIAMKCHESLVTGMVRKYGVTHSYQIEGVSEKAQESKEKTNLERYGETSFFKTEQYRDIIKEKYGVEHPSQSKEIREKTEKTNRERYGVSTPLVLSEVQKKAIESSKVSNLEKYGTPYYLQSEKGRNKARATNTERYGVPNPLQNEDILRKNKESLKKTTQDKYGVDYYFQTEEFKETSRNTCMEKYGVPYSSQNPLIKEKSTITCLKRYGVPYPSQNPNIKYRILSHQGMTKPEKKMNEFLKNRGFDYTYQYECNGKCFDFAIFKNNELSILVEIDGEYFHGLLSDCDGKLVRGDKDCERFNKCPENVKLIVCDSLKIENCFSEILRVFDIDYEKWIQEIIDNLPKEFPYYEYSEDRMKKDYEKLCTYKDIKKNSRLGDSIISNFHKSIYDASVRNCPSPRDAWEDSKLLEKCVRNRFIYSSTLSSHSILQGFNVCKIAPKVSVFNASLAKRLILKYLNNYSEIFDPFSGFSGRMLGACSLGKSYIGQDINESHIEEGKQIIDLLKLDNTFLRVQDIFTSEGSYECLFTCPPYGLKEEWRNINQRNLDCDGWINECLKRFKCKTYLFVVDETEKYKDYIVEELSNNSHLGENKEFVIKVDL